MMDSVWHLAMTETMYLAMCSERVKTLPWPMGALGPRKAVWVGVLAGGAGWDGMGWISEGRGGERRGAY